MKKFFTIAAMAFTAVSFAQTGNVGINTSTPNVNAVLDIVSTNKGLLPPRVALTATNSPAPLGGNVQGMVVYNTATAGTAPNNVVPGLYYNNGTIWVPTTDSNAVTSVSNTSAGNNLSTTVNGITGATVPMVNSNAVSATNGNLISTVNGVASTPAVPVLIAASNGLTATNGDVKLGGTLSQPTNIAASAANTLTLSGLQGSAAKTGTLVADGSGIVRLQDRSTLSAVRVDGNLTITGAENNLFFYTNKSGTAINEDLDNLNEFSGNTFTASQSGLYRVQINSRYDQHTNAVDSGDGYVGCLRLMAGNGPFAGQYGPFFCGKVPIVEVGGTFVPIGVPKTDLVKLNAGQVVQFQILVYGATTNVTVYYEILIERID
ncbi:hypothetical protein HHL23_04580 [Chryseobacterium sp. RP-3-3]|uniref:C1q domain-containing protein n=1 Tax=Chryseobacterium antibioticum TaxID=2728847 RepID=A0A7Y0AKK0_9FLAO|nr:hypothetical protein [Chryseobacterium antibioticum]NML69066.1 hypothetical protein [Chryseobacterium antibioticum]